MLSHKLKVILLLRRVNFSDACSLSKKISTCDNHSETPHCLLEEEVSDMQLFTSSDTRKCREESRDFCNFCVLPHAGKEFFNDADKIRFKIRVVAL